MMRKSIGVAVAIAVFAITGAAQAANWQVAAGEQARPPAGTPKMTTLNSFFPGKLVINAGDSVTFSSASFHTVAYTAGQRPASLFIPDPAKGTYAGINDAAGEAFYFDGLPKFIYNGAAFAPAGGKTITAGVPASSGVLSPQGPKSPPAKVTYTFPKAGAFQLVCTVHPGMKVSVVVKPSGTPVPRSPAQVTAASLVGDVSRLGEGDGACWAVGTQEHRLCRRRRIADDPQLLPAGADGEGGDDREVRQQVSIGGAQRRLRPCQVLAGVPEDDRLPPCRSEPRRTR